MSAELLDVATKAAQRAADYLVAGWSGRAVVDTKSSGTDVVTQMDRGSESVLVEEIRRTRPRDAILGEEGGSRPGDTDVTWVIDPLDGTVNYLYGLPSWAVSVGVLVGGRPVVGVVNAPALDCVWRGVDGEGRLAEVNGRPILASSCASLDMALVATGFGYDPQVRADQGGVVARLLPRIRDIRRAGAAAVDMCWVAQGLVDAYYERGTHPWDRAAGTAIARAAGAVVTGLHGDEPTDEMTVACGKELSAALRTALVGAGA